MTMKSMVLPLIFACCLWSNCAFRIIRKSKASSQLNMTSDTISNSSWPSGQYGALQPFLPRDSISIRSKMGGWYWARVTDNRDKYGDFDRIMPAKQNIDPSAIFEVNKLANGKVTLVSKQNNRYLSVVHRGGVNFIEPVKNSADEFCQFDVVPNSRDPSEVAFRAHHGQFLCFINRGRNFIEAAKLGLDKWCWFEIHPGALTPWTATDVRFDTANMQKGQEQGLFGAEYTQTNRGSLPQTWEVYCTKTWQASTTFKHEHGFKAGVSVEVEASVPFFSKGKIQFSFETEHKFGWDKTSSETIEFGTKFPTTICPWCTGTMVFTVSKSWARIPFTVHYVNWGMGGARRESKGMLYIEDFFNLKATYSDGTNPPKQIRSSDDP